MFLGILHRMILVELLKVFVVSLIGITGMLLMAGIIAEASQQGLGPLQILQIIPLLIPSTLPYTLPTTTLFATCVVYGRMAHDNEILAIKAAGVNVLMVIIPAMLLGVVMSATTMTLYYRVIPHTHGLMRTMFLKDVEELLYAVLRKDRRIAYPTMPYSISVQAVQGRTLKDAVFMRRENGVYDVVANSREAELHVDMQNRLVKVVMREGHIIGRNGEVSAFDYNEFEVPLPDSLGSEYVPRPRDLSWRELFVRRKQLEKNVEDSDLEYERAKAGAPPPNPAEDPAKYVETMKGLCRYFRGEIRNIDTELLMRPALSLGCLCFVLVGCPVGIWLSRSDYLSSFITCFLPIVFIYYPLVLCGSNLARDGKPFPMLTVWAADIVLASVAIVLSWRIAKN